jgi:hypothetical protein
MEPRSPAVPDVADAGHIRDKDALVKDAEGLLGVF